MSLEKLPRILPPAFELQANQIRPIRTLSDSDSAPPAFPWAFYLRLLLRHWPKILLCVVCVAAATFFYLQKLPPVYESTATIDIDHNSPSTLIGQESSQISPGAEEDQFLATQVELIKSDEVLRPVVTKYHLLKEEGQLTRSSISNARLIDAPVLLKNLTVLRKPNSFLIRISYRSVDPHLAADVANAVARSYLDRTYEIRLQSTLGLSAVMERQIGELRVKMERSREALAKYERDLNVIDPADKTNILSARLLQLNSEYTTAQADRLRKQSAYYSIRNNDLSALQLSDSTNILGKLEERIQAAQTNLAELKTTYGPNYSLYKRTANQLAELRQQYADSRTELAQRIASDYHQAEAHEGLLKSALLSTKTDFDKLSLKALEYQQLKRDAEADKSVYDELDRKIKEAGINAGFQTSAIRIADTARPGAFPVAPPKHLILALVSFLSLVLSCSVIILHRWLNGGINDAEQATRSLQVQVVGVLPVVNDRKLLATMDSRIGTTLAVANARDRKAMEDLFFYKESIRMLRASIFGRDLGPAIKSILVTSAVPGEGKSTTASSLAIANAGRNKTLLLDADLRLGSQHVLFGLENTVGLSTILSTGRSWRDAVVPIEKLPNLHVFPCGPVTGNATDLLGLKIKNLLRELSDEYNTIIIDAPPLIAFAESLEIACAVDGVLVVTRAASTSGRDVAGLLKTLDRMSVVNVRLVLNQIDRRLADTRPARYRGYYSQSA